MSLVAHSLSIPTGEDFLPLLAPSRLEASLVGLSLVRSSPKGTQLWPLKIESLVRHRQTNLSFCWVRYENLTSQLLPVEEAIKLARAQIPDFLGAEVSLPAPPVLPVAPLPAETPKAPIAAQSGVRRAPRSQTKLAPIPAAQLGRSPVSKTAKARRKPVLPRKILESSPSTPTARVRPTAKLSPMRAMKPRGMRGRSKT